MNISSLVLEVEDDHVEPSSAGSFAGGFAVACALLSILRRSAGAGARTSALSTVPVPPVRRLRGPDGRTTGMLELKFS